MTPIMETRPMVHVFLFCLRNRPSIMYVCNQVNGGGHLKFLQMCTGEEGYHASCVRTHLHYLFSCFMVVC